MRGSCLAAECSRSVSHEGIVVYTKGALRRFEGEDYFYVFVSAKRSVDD